MTNAGTAFVGAVVAFMLFLLLSAALWHAAIRGVAAAVQNLRERTSTPGRDDAAPERRVEGTAVGPDRLRRP